MMTTLLGLHTVPIVLALAMGPPSGEVDDGDLVPAVLRIDVSALATAQEQKWVDHMQKIAERYLPPMLEERGVELVDTAEGDAATITVVVSWVDYEASIYATDITVTRPGYPEQELDRILCEPCMDHMVIERLEPHFDDVVPWLAVGLPKESEGEPEPAGATGSREAGETEGASSNETPATNEGGVDSTASPPLGRLGWAGVATAGVGALTLISGGIVYARGEREVISEPWFDQDRDFRPAGVATMVVGGIVVCAGAAMLGVDLARRKTRRTTAAVSLHPAFSGLSVTRRF